MPSGEIRWRLLTSAPRRLPNRHILWDGIEIDIAERKRAEETILDRERYLRKILETTGDGFLVLDSQGFVIEVNQAYCVMFGYTAEVITHNGVLDKDVHFIQKPFLTRDLAVKIREALQEH